MSQEKDLKSDSQLLFQVLEHLSEGIVVVDLQGAPLKWNRAALAMHGYRQQVKEIEFLTNALQVYEFFTLNGEPVPFDQWPVNRILRGEHYRNYELILRHRQKSWEKIFQYDGALIDDRKHPPFGLLTIRDITHQKQSQLALIESKQRFHTLADNLPQLCWMADKTGARFWFNQQWYDYTGTELKDVSGWRWQKWHHPDYRPHIIPQMKYTFRKGGVWENTYPLRGKNGEYRWFLSRALPIRDDQGNIFRWLGTNTDITEFRELQEALKKSESKLRKFFEANVVGMIYWNIDGKVTEANDIFLEMVGYTRQNLIEGKINWIAMTPPEYWVGDKAAVADLADLGYPLPIEKEYICKDGSRIPVLVGSTYVDETKQSGVGIVLDIRELKRLERQKDEFIAVASHELKTPVTSLKAYTQALRHSLSKSADRQSINLLDKMEKQTKKLTVLINDLLDITKVQTGQLKIKPVTFNFNDVVTESCQQVQAIYPHHRIEIQLTANPTVHADRERIGQVITNLLTNAVKYSPQAQTVNVTSWIKDGQVTLCVQDFGMGIPLEKQSHIFQRFYRVEDPLRETYPGMGLGLYISSEIIRHHQGKIWFESTADQGSSFCFSLPLVIPWATER